MSLRVVLVGPIVDSVVSAIRSAAPDAEIVRAPTAGEARARLDDSPSGTVWVERDRPWGSIPFSLIVRTELARAKRYDHPLSLVVLGLDEPAALSRSHGDEVLETFVSPLEEMLRRAVRQVDWVARTGAHEISAVLPETATAGAEIMAERVRKVARSLLLKPSIPGQPSLPLKATWSVGIAGFTGDRALASETLLAAARKALDEARTSGGDQIATAVDDPRG